LASANNKSIDDFRKLTERPNLAGLVRDRNHLQPLLDKALLQILIKLFNRTVHEADGRTFAEGLAILGFLVEMIPDELQRQVREYDSLA